MGAAGKNELLLPPPNAVFEPKEFVLEGIAVGAVELAEDSAPHGSNVAAVVAGGEELDAGKAAAENAD